MTKGKILIVDDDPDMRELLNFRLRASGYFAPEAVAKLVDKCARGRATGATPSAHCETSARGRRAPDTAGRASDRGSDGNGRRPLARSAPGS